MYTTAIMDATIISALHKLLTFAGNTSLENAHVIMSVFIESNKLLIIPLDVKNDNATLECCNVILEFSRLYNLRHIIEIEPSGWKPEYGDAYQYAMNDIENKSAFCIRWNNDEVYISTVRDEEILISDYRL